MPTVTISAYQTYSKNKAGSYRAVNNSNHLAGNMNSGYCMNNFWYVADIKPYTQNGKRITGVTFSCYRVADSGNNSGTAASLYIHNTTYTQTTARVASQWLPGASYAYGVGNRGSWVVFTLNATSLARFLSYMNAQTYAISLVMNSNANTMWNGAITGNKPYLRVTYEDASIRVNQSGTWKSGVPYINSNGVWKRGEAWVNKNGVWVKGI